MHQVQFNLMRQENDFKLKVSPRKIALQCETSTPSLLWWKELNINKRLLSLIPKQNVCVFCLSAEDCENKLGEFLYHPFSGLRMHYFCLLLSSGLTQSDDETKDQDIVIDKYSVYGFYIKDILQEIKRASRLRCSFCHKQGASIGCVESSCKTKFHFICGLDKCVLSQFCDNFKSYCIKHRPKQSLRISRNSLVEDESNEDGENSHVKVSGRKYSKEKISQCPICLEDILCSLDGFHSLATPCCCDVWLHRSCVQQQAYSSGAHFFRCPVCNDTRLFVQEMLRMGIYVPERDASWELAHDAYSELLQRHNQCDKPTCLCPYGSDFNMKGTEWEIVLCDLCGSSGTHIACDEDVESTMAYYACHNCCSIYGAEGSRKLAEDMGILVEPPRRSRRVRRLSAAVSERPKRLRIDMVC